MIYSFSGWQLDLDARELRSEAGSVHMEHQVYDVLRYLVENRARVVPKIELLDAVWGDRFVSDSAVTSRIKSARAALGDSGSKQKLIKTYHGVGYRFVADDVSIVDASIVDAPIVDASNIEASIVENEAGGQAGDLKRRGRRPVGRFRPRGWTGSRAEDRVCRDRRMGVSLAMAETGRGPCLVKTATFLTQVDKDAHDSPIWGHWVRGLSRTHRYVRYDPRRLRVVGSGSRRERSHRSRSVDR